MVKLLKTQEIANASYLYLRKSSAPRTTTVDKLSARKDLSPKVYAEFACQWVEAGATIIGGCCEIGPEHIDFLCQQLKANGHRLTTLPV